MSDDPMSRSSEGGGKGREGRVFGGYELEWLLFKPE